MGRDVGKGEVKIVPGPSVNHDVGQTRHPGVLCVLPAPLSEAKVWIPRQPRQVQIRKGRNKFFVVLSQKLLQFYLCSPL